MREDPSAAGLSRGWQRGGFTGATVGVPDTRRPRAFRGRAGEANYAGSVAWYRTNVRAAGAAVYALHFTSAGYRARVWVDGRALGSHHGAYLPFELRARLAAGSHTLVVRVDWRDPRRQSREGFHRAWFNWGGLNGTVDIRAVGASELSAPSIATTLTPGGASGGATGGPASVRVGVLVHNDGPARTIVATGTLTRGSQQVPFAFAPVTLGHGGSATTTATVQVPAPALWAPSHPALYDLELAVPGESSYAARVGLRELSWRGGRLYLNGAPLRLRGASIQQDALGHGDSLSAGDYGAIVAELRAIGANTVRSQHPLDPALLERLDAAGILVWQGIGPVEGAGVWYSNTPRLLAEAEGQAETAALAARLHPSIVVWNLVDEVAGNGRDAAEVAYVRHVSAWLHANDPGRPVAVDVWGDHPPRRAGPLYAQADAVAQTDYVGWYDDPRADPARRARLMRARLAAMKRTFAGKILLISEFGAESNTLNPRGAAGSYGYQTRLLAEHIAVYTADPQLTGMLIWLLRDYPLTPRFQGGSIHRVLPELRLIEGINQKGLFTYGGHAKPAARVVARLFNALPDAG